jgi:UDP-glucose 4-epimerase
VVLLATGSHSEVRFGAYDKRSFDALTWVADIEKTKTLLGFESQYGLTAGLKESILWFQEHAHYYKK